MIICRTISLFVLFFLLFNACQQDTATAESDTPITTSDSLTLKTAEGVEQIWQTDAVFQTPESVVYDPIRRKLYVSNIVGAPGKKDGEGFLSVVDLDGKVEQLHWIEGFNAPKGLYIHDDLLYVADIDQVVIVSILEGGVIKKIDVPEAKFLNAITYLPGTEVILITDTDTNRIYWLDADGRVDIWSEDKLLNSPNGLFYHNKSLLVASFKGQQVLSIDPIELAIHPLVSGIGAGDGILVTPIGDTIVSDWGGKIYQIKDAQAQLLIDLSKVNENAADIEWVDPSNLLIVPTFFGNSLRAFHISNR